MVTALFDIGRGQWRRQARSFSQYLDFSRQLLSLDVNMVVFVDPKALDFVRKHRVACQDRTVIIPIKLGQLEYYKYRPRMKMIMASDQFQKDNQLVNNAEGFSPDYDIIMNSKFYLLNNVTYSDPFRSSHFMWIDSGYGHGQDIGFPENGVWIPKKFLASKRTVTVIQMNDPRDFQNVPQLYKLDTEPVFVGGCFGGDKSAIRRLHGIHSYLFKKAMYNGWVDDDQTFLLLSYYNSPGLFSPVKGGYWSVFDVL